MNNLKNELLGNFSNSTKYDLYGYFLPGLFFTFLILFYEWLFQHKVHKIFTGIAKENERILYTQHLYVYKFFSSLSNYITEHNNLWVIHIVLLIVIYYLLYTFGHIIASISSIVIDKVMINKIYSYPYTNLLKFSKNCKNYDEIEERKKLKKAFYSSLFFYINLLFLSLYFSFLFKITKKTILHSIFDLSSKLLLIILFILLFYKIIINITRNKDKTPKYKINFIEKIIILLSTPYKVLSIFISNYIGTQKEFPEGFITLFDEKFKKTFDNLEPCTQESNTYWLSYAYVINNSIEYNQMIKNWLYLYSFLRNLSVSFYLTFLYILINTSLKSYDFSKLGISITSVLYIFPLICFFFSIFLLIRYYYLYYSYYSKFIFRAFVTLTRNKTNQ